MPPSILRRALGGAIRELRRQARYSQAELARLLHISRRHLVDIERGHESFQVDILLALPELLHIPATFVIEEYERQRALVPSSASPSEGRLEMTMLTSGILAVAMTIPLDPLNAMPFTLDYFTRARKENASKILVHPPPVIELSYQQRYRVSRDAAEWLKGQNYSPRVATLTDSPLDRFSIEVAADRGLEAAAFSDEQAAHAWLAQD
jgi:transcriptional regulator with XRE-family HTH domain